MSSALLKCLQIKAIMRVSFGLLNRYTVKSRIGGSNPPLSASFIIRDLRNLGP
jgi:hypothetical protein